MKRERSILMLLLTLPALLLGSWTEDLKNWASCFDERVSWFFEGELLVFRPNLENLSYAKQYTLDDVNILPSTFIPVPGFPFYDLYSGHSSESEKRVNFNYSPGFRGTIGAKFNDYELETALIWTTLFSSSNGKAKGKMNDLFSGSLIQAPFPVINFGTAIGEISALASAPVTAARYNYSLHFDEGDILFFKKLSLCRNIVIEPAMGISGVVINQKFKTTFRQSPNFEGALPFLAMNILHDQSLRFQGIGGKAGMTTHWFLNPNLNIFGSLFGALYYGDFDVKQVAVEVATILAAGGPPDGVPAGNIRLNDHNRFQDVRFAGTVSLGVEYGLSFNCNKNIAIARFSWEGNWFPSQNMLGVYSSTGSIQNVLDNPDLREVDNTAKANIIGGDLSMSGWVLSLLVGF